jgi:hypothetical protein
MKASELQKLGFVQTASGWVKPQPGVTPGQTPCDVLVPKKKTRATRLQARDGSMNKTEAAYSQHLEALKQAGMIARWDFEPEKLRLADRTFFTPDFRVILADGTIQFHEVKGHWEDDARVKIKVAAEMHPYEFLAVQKKGAAWKQESF